MPENALSLKSFAKINWTLRVLGKRNDSFHELFTVFQTVSLHDTISFEKAAITTLTCNRAYVPTDERNLILQAADALRARVDLKQGAAIDLDKQIPSPGGLGGGSSNAAVALIGLSRLWELEIEPEMLHEIAAELGSDVPFFLHGGTAIGTGRGENIKPAADISAPEMLIVTPQIDVSTREAFGKLNAPTLTSETASHILTVCRNETEAFDPRRSALKNDLEPTVFDAHPEIRRVKQRLFDLGAVNAAMSGSGASVFAIFDNTETRQAAEKALDHESTWRKFAVATVSRDEYCEALLLNEG